MFLTHENGDEIQQILIMPEFEYCRKALGLASMRRRRKQKLRIHVWQNWGRRGAVRWHMAGDARKSMIFCPVWDYLGSSGLLPDASMPEGTRISSVPLRLKAAFTHTHTIINILRTVRRYSTMLPWHSEKRFVQVVPDSAPLDDSSYDLCSTNRTTNVSFLGTGVDIGPLVCLIVWQFFDLREKEDIDKVGGRQGIGYRREIYFWRVFEVELKVGEEIWMFTRVRTLSYLLGTTLRRTEYILCRNDRKPGRPANFYCVRVCKLWIVSEVGRME